MPLSVGQLDTLSQHNYPVDTNLGLCSSSYYLDDGTFSSVVRVRHAESGELYAAKVVDKLLIMKNNKAAAVMAEKSILLSLSHENVVKLYCTFQDATSLYFILEYCSGGNLLKHRSALSIRPLIQQLVAGLMYLHTNGILHRDLKPENLLLRQEWDNTTNEYKQILKIADFGSALSLRSSLDLSKELNAFVGTPNYLCPEILQGQVQAETAFAVDWWAAGCCAYWVLSRGKILFDAATEYLVYKAIENGPHLSIVKECCEADDVVGEIIIGLLELNPKRRLDFVNGDLLQLITRL